MKTVKNWTLLSQNSNRIDLECDQRHILSLFVLEHGLIRVLFQRNKHLQLDRTWSIATNDQDVAWEGRPRLSTAGFSLPGYQLAHTDGQLTVTTEQLRLTVTQPLRLQWEHKNDSGQWVLLASDRKSSAYRLGVQQAGCSHFMTRMSQERYYGLGEKTGPLERNSQRYQMLNMDAMGYDASRTDPLYKHIPFYITHTPQASYGLFYDNLATSWFDLGNELDYYHGDFRSYRAEEGDLDYYFIYGPRILAVTQAYTRLTGRTAFGPKWSLGYSGSTMHYTDADNAQEQLLQFVELCQQQHIPCDSFQLSSGYTSIAGKRYVFNWNYDKVPQPEKLAADFDAAGLKLAANIKPCLLLDHPRYEAVAKQGLFIQDSEHDQPECSQFWDDEGSHLDFTHPDTVRWWQDNVKTQLLEKGIVSTWNDNNEYEVWDGDARCHGFGQNIPVKLIRPLQTLLMMRASFEAQTAYAPTLRPYLISRAGCGGMQRYAQTWSGDNRTSWQTLRYNLYMGLGLSLSGVFNTGHDVGGFAGERPDPELFVRWVQNGIMHPRFTIHSWNDDGSANEPWMYPEVTPIVRATLALRYRLLPYIYHQLWLAHSAHEPMLRPCFLDHEHDLQCFAQNDEFLLGRDLLVAAIVEPGQRERTLYLPANGSGWYDFHTGTWYAGGQHITLPAPLEHIPLLARAGSIIPGSARIAHVDVSQDHERQLMIFPLQGVGQSECSLFDDDGESTAFMQNGYLMLNITMRCDDQQIQLSISRSGHWQAAYDGFSLQLPPQEQRPLWVNGRLYQAGERFLLSDAKNKGAL